MGQETAGNQDISLGVGLFIAFLCVLFGANAVAIKISLSGMGPFTIAWIRFSMASVAVTLWAKLGKRSLVVRRDQYVSVAVISVVFTVQLSLFYLGLERSNASRGTLIVNILPFLVLLLSTHSCSSCPWQGFFSAGPCLTNPFQPRSSRPL